MSPLPTRSLAATVDALEGDHAVLDVDGIALRLPLAFLPDGVAEGSGVRITLTLDPAIAAELARAVAERLHALQNPPPKR